MSVKRVLSHTLMMFENRAPRNISGPKRKKQNTVENYIINTSLSVLLTNNYLGEKFKENETDGRTCGTVGEKRNS